MVNTGKPSGGCKQCLARRIKCDETKPACLRCLRSKRECPGYRDPFEFKIRDETQSTIRKFKRAHLVVEKEQVLREAGVVDDGDVDFRSEPDAEREDEDVKADVESWTSGYFNRRGSGSPTSPTSSEESFAVIHKDFITSLVTPTEQQATCYLLSDYVLISDSPGGRRGYFKFAYKMLTRPTKPARCLLSAFKAVSFVALASRPGAGHLVIEAESHYSKALREVTRAIQDPVQVQRDDTLAAVLLLAFYETLSSTRESLDEYVSHIKGAAQLVRMRGTTQHDTDEGAEMFSMTRNQFLALRSLSPSSPESNSDYAWLLRESCPDAYVSRVATLTIACSDVRMKVDRALLGKRGQPIDTSKVRELLHTAQVLAKKLDGLDQPQNAVWRVHIKDHNKNHQYHDDYHDAFGDMAGCSRAMVPPLPPGYVYDFHNLYVCMIYSIIWTSHLFLSTCIFRCMAYLARANGEDEWRSGEEYASAVQATKRRIADIVASMPYACSWNGYQTDFADFACGTATATSQPKGVAGMCVYRPAFTAMTSDYATPAQKRYLHNRLQFLSDVVGIKQINVLLRIQHESAHPSHFIERDKERLQV